MNQPGNHSRAEGRSRGSRPHNIVKIGGSLLELPDLTDRLGALLEQLDGQVALLVGGGPAANAVRRWATVFELDDSTSHWLAVDSLSLTARLVCELLNRDGGAEGQYSEATAVVEDWPAACHAVRRGLIPILNPRGLLSPGDGETGIELPDSWAVTSDSIAAAIAIRWNVSRLVLCKSVDVPEDGLLAGQVSADSLPVDGWFGQLTPDLAEIQWCNLRSSPIRCVPWRPL